MRFSLKKKLFLIVLGFILFFVLLPVLFVELHLKRVIETESIEGGEALASLLAANITDDVLTRNYTAVDVFFENTMKSNRDVSYMFIEKDGTVLIHTFREGFPRGLLHTGHSRTTPNYLIVNTAGRKLYDFAAPIMGGKVGVLRVGISEGMLEKAISRATLIFIVSGIIVAFISAGFSLLISRRISRPLIELTASADEIAQGNYSKTIPVFGSEEVAELARAFNSMIEAVRTRERELRETNDQLEAYGVRMYEYIEELNRTKDELVRAKQDTAVVETSRAFLHHVRQPLTYLIMATEMLTEQLSQSHFPDDESVHIKLKAIEDAGKRLAEMLRKFEQLKLYKTVSYSDTTRIVDIEE